MKKVLTLLLILVVTVFVWFYFQNSKVYEFGGNVDRVENGIVFATGYFSEDGVPIQGQEGGPANIQIVTDSETVITRLALQIPINAGVFYPDELEQAESVVGLETIEADSLQPYAIGIEGKLKKGFFDSNFTARSLYFRVPMFENQI